MSVPSSPSPGSGGTISTIGRYAIAALIIFGIIAVLYVLASAVGIAIPGWVITVLWIVLAVTVGVAVIKWLLSLR